MKYGEANYGENPAAGLHGVVRGLLRAFSWPEGLEPPETAAGHESTVDGQKFYSVKVGDCEASCDHVGDAFALALHAYMALRGVERPYDEVLQEVRNILEGKVPRKR